MKIGAEDRNKLIAAIVLMVLAAISLSYVLSRPGTPAAAAPPAATPPAKRPTGRRATGQAIQQAENLDPTLRLNLLRSSEGVKYEGTGRNIFLAHAEEPLPKPKDNPLKEDKKVPQPPPGPPPPPPINLKFYGFANKPGETKKIFLSEGDNIFIAGEGDVVNRRYKVVKIGQTSVEIEDLLNNNKQTIPLSSQS